MKTDYMVRMANQIALNFATYPHEEAVANTTKHLKDFWERRMKQQLFDYIANGGSGLHELVLEAAKRLQQSQPAGSAR